MLLFAIIVSGTAPYVQCVALRNILRRCTEIRLVSYYTVIKVSILAVKHYLDQPLRLLLTICLWNKYMCFQTA